MATSPRVGRFRDSMLINPGIIEAPLGKCRSRGFSIPGPDFIYGLGSCKDRGGVAEALSNWNEVCHSGQAAPILPPMDFVALNRDAVKSGVVTVKELNQYRTQRPPQVQPTRQQQQQQQRQQQQGSQDSMPDLTIDPVYRTNTPMGMVLAHDYGNHWIEEQWKRTEMENRRLSAARVKRGTVSDTRTSRLRKTNILLQKQVENQVQTLSSTKLYSQVGPAVDTFRNPESRTRALEALKGEAASRRGQGRGIYTLD